MRWPPVPAHTLPLSCAGSRSSQLISLELNKLTLKRFQHPSRVLTGTCSESGSCATLHAHGFFTWDTHGESPHVLYHTGPVFWGGRNRLSTACRLIPRRCVCCSVSAGGDRRGPACLRITGGHIVETSCRFDLCLTEVADRATVQRPPKADRKPRVLRRLFYMLQ